jgi:3-hydroxyisobutyrate dehydrogenase
VLFGEQGARQAMRQGSVLLMSVTVPPDYAERLGPRLAKRGILMIDGPVSGGEAKAATGEMTMMAAGPAEAFATCEPVLAAIAQKVYRLGEAHGTGSKVKMINQLLAGVHIAAAAEAMALGIKAGADPKTLYDVITNSAGNSWMFQNRAPHILAGDYLPRSAVNIFVKDLGIVLEAGRKSTFPLPLTAAAHQMFLMAAAAGHGREDGCSRNQDLPRHRSAGLVRMDAGRGIRQIVVIPVLVTGIHPAARSGARCLLDSGHKAQDDNGEHIGTADHAARLHRR